MGVRSFSFSRLIGIEIGSAVILGVGTKRRHNLRVVDRHEIANFELPVDQHRQRGGLYASNRGSLAERQRIGPAGIHAD